ncbi:hypothetical protein ACYOEI_34135 [Singulisphaera rosea]
MTSLACPPAPVRTLRIPTQPQTLLYVSRTLIRYDDRGDSEERVYLRRMTIRQTVRELAECEKGYPQAGYAETARRSVEGGCVCVPHYQVEVIAISTAVGNPMRPETLARMFRIAGLEMPEADR